MNLVQSEYTNPSCTITIFTFTTHRVIRNMIPQKGTQNNKYTVNKKIHIYNFVL